MQDDLPEDVDVETASDALLGHTLPNPPGLSALLIDRQEDFALTGDEPDIDPAAAFVATHRHLVGVDPSLVTPVNRLHWDAEGNMIVPPNGGMLYMSHSSLWTDHYDALKREMGLPNAPLRDSDWFGELPTAEESQG